MKKILAILASVGLASTSTIAVVACQPEKQAPNLITPIGTTVDLKLTQTFQKGEVLAETDQERLNEEILRNLKIANSDGNVTDTTFEFDLTQVTADWTALMVKVNETKGQENLSGIEVGEVEVTLNLTLTPMTPIEATGTDVVWKLKQTKKNEILTSDDQNLLKNQIIKELSVANSGAANVNGNTFQINVSQVTSETPSLSVLVKSTASDGHQPGLKGKAVEVKLFLTSQFWDAKDAQGSAVEFQLTKTQPGQILDPIDQELLKNEILSALNLANSGVVINEDTFVIDLNEVTHKSTKVSIHVNPTDSTADLPGLKEGDVEVKLSLNLPVLEKVEVVVPTTIEFSLSETHLDENLSSEDEQKLHTLIVQEFLNLNSNTTATEGTFDFNLSEIKVSDEVVELPVIVNETESTSNKSGLIGDTVAVNLHLTAQVLDPIQAQTFNLSLQLEETKPEAELTEKDKEFVRGKIIEELLKVNAHTTATAESFEIDLDGITPKHYSNFEVKVLATPSTKEKPGLKAETIFNELALKPNW